MIFNWKPFLEIFDQADLCALLKVFYLLFCVFAKQNLYTEVWVSFWVWVIYSKQL